MERQSKTLTLIPFIALTFSFLLTNTAAGQGTRPPDCYRSFTFTAAPTNGATLSNYGPGSPDGGQACTVWQLAYAVSNVGGTVTSLSLDVESAPAATATTPGTWVTFAGTISTGINPNTSTVGAQTFLSNGIVAIPFIRVSLTALSATGTTTVFGILQGWTEGNSGGGGGGSGGCPGTVATPCVTGAENSSAAAVTDFVCDKTAAITISGSGLTQIIALSGSTSVRLCHINFSNSASSNVTIEEGTGSNCGTGTTAVSGVYQSLLAIALDFTSRDALTFAAGSAVCLNFGSSVTAGGMVQYAQF